MQRAHEQKPILALVAALSFLLAACGGSSPTTASIGPIAMGELFPMTGQYPFVGTQFLNGSKVALKEIQSNGGVGGAKITEYLGDTSFDAVDAVTAFRQIETNHLTFMVGPTSSEFTGVQPLVDASHIPSFSAIANIRYDTMNDKWVYRAIISDAALGKGMAYYAIKNGFTKCSALFENTANAQTLVPTIVASYMKNGGTILANVQLVPHQSSYRTEIVKAFADNPQCVFIQTDPQTSGTLFSNLRELGHENVPFVGTDAMRGSDVTTAIGPADASKWLTAMSSAPPAGASYTYFAQQYKAMWNADPTDNASEMYDSTTIAALAMTAAGSSDPNVWVNKITSVTSDETGTECANYGSCVALLKKSQKIDFEGAYGPDDYDSHHSIYTGFEVVHWDVASNQAVQVMAIAPADLLNF